jgi:hypothetical protein
LEAILKITKGTPQAMEWLELFKKEGNLTDVYSKEFFDRQPTYDEEPEAPYYKNGLEYIDQLENDSNENVKPKNHLLFIFLDEYKRELINKLLAVCPLLVKHFDGLHKPDFIILNLYTKQMLCVGFGRKNRIFAYDPAYDQSIDFFGLTGNGDSGKYLDKFMEHDCYETVKDFTQALATLSEAMFDWDHLPHNPEMLEIALDEGRKSDGLYYVEDDEDGYTKEDLEGYIKEYADAQRRQDEAMKVIHIFFPAHDWWELNTGDY